MALDALDQNIIMALEDDGRRPYRDIARELGVAEATVRARVSRLVDGGLIRITAVGDPLSLGVEVAAITLVRTKPGCVRQTAEAIKGFGVAVLACQGQYRITRQQLLQAENKDRDQDQRGDRNKHPPEDMRQHLDPAL